MADGPSREDLSVPGIMDKLFEGCTIKMPMDVFFNNDGYKAFVNNLRTAKSRMTKKFRSLGMEFESDQMVLSVSTISTGYDTPDTLVLKLVPPKQPKFCVIVEPPAPEC